jgi:hypothetical protein
VLIKNANNFHFKSFQNLPKWDFRFENIPSRNTGHFLFQCTKNKAWKDIAAQLGIGASSSGAYTLKKHYGKNLLAYECHFDRGGMDPGPILEQVKLLHANLHFGRKTILGPIFKHLHSGDKIGIYVPYVYVDTSVKGKNLGF